MKLPLRMSIAALCALALLLAACNQPTAKAPPPNFVTLSIKVDGATLNGGDALQPQGIPTDPKTGDIVLDAVQVTVRDKNNDVVQFQEDAGTYVAAETGAGYIELGAGGEAKVSLPSHLEPFTFESIGMVNKEWVGYHSVKQEVTQNANVTITLESILGGAVLTPRYPTNFVVPGEIIDLMLVVMANGNDSFPDDYLQVPTGDFTVRYDSITGGIIENESNRGIRVTADAFCTEIEVNGWVTGLRLDSDEVSTGSDPLSLAKQLECVPAAKGSLRADLVAPIVTLDYNMATGQVTGAAEDNLAIAKLEIFDGPVLVATTDGDDIGPDVAEIAFIAGTNEFRAKLTVDPIGGLRALAYDHAGNVGTSEETAKPESLIVEEGGSIQDALDNVADGGTVYLPSGTFEGDLEISGDVTIVGDPEGGTIITPSGVTSSGLSYALQSATDERRGKAVLEITGPDTVARISDVTIMGEGRNNCPNVFAGVRVSYGATLHLSRAKVTDVAEGFASCGVGILVGRNITTETHSYDERYSGTAYLSDVELENFGKTAIVIEHPESIAYINGGQIVGIGETDKGAQNGVQVSRGGNAEIRNMSIQDVRFYRESGSDDTAAGILLYEPGEHVVIEGNTISDSGNGVTVLRQAPGGSVTITGNVFENNLMHVENANPAELDLSGNTFDGVNPGSASLQDLLELEDKIEHVLDSQASLDGWWKPQPEDYGLARVVPGNLYVTEASGSIQRAIDAAKPGDIIHVDPEGDFEDEVLTVDVPYLTIFGNDATVSNVNLAADGVTIENLNIEPTSHSHALVIREGRDIVLNNVDIVTTGMGIRFLNSGGNADYSGFTMSGGSIKNANIGISLEHHADYANGKTAPISFEDVTITGVAFSGIPFKGIYLEALSNATLSYLTFDNVGNEGYGDSSNLGAWGAAIDINLKYGAYESLTLQDITVTDSGYSKGHETGAAVTIKARDDGSYATNPASLDGAEIEEVSVVNTDGDKEPYAALRIGEPDATNPDNSETNHTTINVVVKDSVLDGVYSVMNYTSEPVDATSNNVISGDTFGKVTD